ncbi:hypothetical protein F5Y09DRAFT_326652 [Xylaria sp. FL1042]|nr:hypothetical protein F5Y09DRAFT_326652 [Xylaria sp. FL1042]
MLPRQFHRPLLQSVTAVWRPATAFSTSSRRGDSSNSKEDNEGSSSQAPARREPSLFEQLFPDETKGAKAKSPFETDASKSKSWASQLFRNEELPRLPVPEELRHNEDAVAARHDGAKFSLPTLGAQSMLILSAASKNLLESDFLRLGVKGKHVEGWVGGFRKVVQARNPDTLEPMGRYFILFDTDAAATAYKDRITHLWRLGKEHIPGAHHSLKHTHQQPLPLGLARTETGEDVAQLLRSFTLVPPSQKLLVDQPTKLRASHLAELRRQGGLVDDLLRSTTGGGPQQQQQVLVLVRLDGGRLTVDTLRRAVEEDGVQRNLAWRIKDLRNAILPFGKSIVKTKDRAHVEALAQAQAQAQAQTPAQAPAPQRAAVDEDARDNDLTANTSSSDDSSFEGVSAAAQGFGEEGVGDGSNDGGGNGEDHPPSSSSSSPYSGGTSQTMVKAVDEAVGNVSDKRYRQYARFIIPFMDKEEAYRFVQNWHRRELKLLMGRRRTRKDPSWEETRIVNASVLW